MEGLRQNNIGFTRLSIDEGAKGSCFKEGKESDALRDDGSMATERVNINTDPRPSTPIVQCSTGADSGWFTCCRHHVRSRAPLLRSASSAQLTFGSSSGLTKIVRTTTRPTCPGGIEALRFELDGGAARYR